MNYSFSTSWNSTRHKNGFDLIEEIKAIGFDTVELNFALTQNVVDDIATLVRGSKIKVSSIHNICPLPKDVEPKDASPDYYSLASWDKEERGIAVGVTKNTIDYAGRLGAKAVILHTGRVPIKDKTRRLASLINDKEQFGLLKAEMIKEREENKGGCLDNVVESLKELTGYAKKAGIHLGVENRYYYREIPLAEELDLIFKNFKAGDLYYWHDTGHAEVFERLGFVRHKDLLDKYSNRLIGIHLHDIIGVIEDHRPPGMGTFDFRMLKPYIKDDTIKVVEAHQPASAEEIRQSVKYLEKIFS